MPVAGVLGRLGQVCPLVGPPEMGLCAHFLCWERGLPRVPRALQNLKPEEWKGPLEHLGTHFANLESDS